MGPLTGWVLRNSHSVRGDIEYFTPGEGLKGFPFLGIFHFTGLYVRYVTHDTNIVTENVTLTEDRVTIQEAARIANISRKTLYRWIGKGLLSREKDKNLSYVSLAEVKALCDRVTIQDVTENVTGDNHGTEDTNRVTIDREHYEGLLVRLGQLEAEKRYLLEYKTSLGAKEKELADLRAELDRARLPWYRKLFRHK